MSPAPIPTVTLDGLDAVELYELLGFIADWCAQLPDSLTVDLNRFVGGQYDAGELRCDALRLATAIFEAMK